MTFFTTKKDFLRVGECNQDSVAPALCNIPLWAAELVTPLVAPAPYHIPLRGSECHSEIAPALGENAFWICVLDCSRERYSRHSEAEWQRLKEYLERAECNVVKKRSVWPFRKIRLALTHHGFGARRAVESRVSSGLLFFRWAAKGAMELVWCLV